MWMLLLFVVYQMGVVCFPHVHVVNGVVVIHSHLFVDDSHEHTEQAVVSLQSIGHYHCTDVPECVELEEVNRWSVVYYCASIVSAPQKGMLWAFDQRGPPSVC